MRKWIIKNRDKIDTIEKVFLNRGITDKEAFYKADLRKEKMLDFDKAISILKEKIKNREKIVIYGDYDCDGVSSTSIMVLALRHLGGIVEWYTNNRFTDGYGICKNGVDKILLKHPDTKIIVTVDNGIVAYEAVDYVKSLGLEIIVTDHHEPKMVNGVGTPNADAVIDPKRFDDPYPFKGLCGAGVAWKLCMELGQAIKGKPVPYIEDLIDIAALATVGDVVPLVDENRKIVKMGLEKIREEKRPFFKAIREVTDSKEINAHFTLAFTYVPIINAASRIIGDPAIAIEAVTSDDYDYISQRVIELKRTNDERKELEKSQRAEIENQIDENQKIIVVAHHGLGEGIVGLIAGRIKEKYNRPTIVLSEHNGVMVGSARSIDGFPVHILLNELTHLLIKHGGHDKAAGLSLKAENFKAFKEAVEKMGEERITEDMISKKVYVDDYLKEVTIELIEKLKELEPFGEGFPQPLFMVESEVKDIKYLGKDPSAGHVKLVSEKFDVMIWRNAEHYKNIGEPKRVYALGTPNINVFNNKANIQFIVKDDNITEKK